MSTEHGTSDRHRSDDQGCVYTYTPTADDPWGEQALRALGASRGAIRAITRGLHLTYGDAGPPIGEQRREAYEYLAKRDPATWDVQEEWEPGRAALLVPQLAWTAESASRLVQSPFAHAEVAATAVAQRDNHEMGPSCTTMMGPIRSLGSWRGFWEQIAPAYEAYMAKLQASDADECEPSPESDLVRLQADAIRADGVDSFVQFKGRATPCRAYCGHGQVLTTMEVEEMSVIVLATEAATELHLLPSAAIPLAPGLVGRPQTGPTP